MDKLPQLLTRPIITSQETSTSEVPCNSRACYPSGMKSKAVKYTLLFSFIAVQLVVDVGVIAMQFKTIERTNPDPKGTEGITPEVDDIFRRACYDCHSNEVRWPWYSYIAPISWKIEEHVVDGRRHLNFSTLHQLKPKRQIHKLEEVIDEVSGGGMPLEDYIRVHEDAELTDDEIDLINAWCEKRRAFLQK